jgi:hypothetical protein
MSIKNEMEQLVREEVRRAKELGSPEYAGCWCVICETDIVALALTLLPPLYCREETYGHASRFIKAGTIRDAVRTSLRRVGLRPKHHPGLPRSLQGDVALVNYTFEVGAEMVGPELERAASGCGCERCRTDTLAYALNRYPAKYGIAQGGRRNLDPSYLEFMRHELGLLIGQAARVVSAHPHHH